MRINQVGPRLACCLCAIGLLVPAFGQEKKRVAIYDFDISGVKDRIALDFGPGYNIGRNISSTLLSPLAASGAYEVINRQQIEQIFKEQNLKFSDRFDASNAAAYGRVLGVDAIITGTVENVFVEYRQRVKGVLGVGKKINEVRLQLEVTAQMVSTETAQIFIAPRSFQEIIEPLSSEMGAAVMTGNRRVPNAVGGSGSTSVSRNPAEPALRQAIRQAAEEIAAQIIEKAPTLPRRTSKPVTSTKRPLDGALEGTARSASKSAAPVPTPSPAPKPGPRLEAAVLEVDGKTIFVDKGAAAGLQVGENLEVRRFLRTVANKAGKSVRLDRKIGTIQITEVNPDWSSGLYTGETPPLKNDRVTRVAQ